MKFNGKKPDLNKIVLSRKAFALRTGLLSTLCFFCIVMTYGFSILIPCMVPKKIKAQTAAAFNINNFYGDSAAPEQVLLLDDGPESFKHRLKVIEEAEERIIFSVFLTQKDYYTDIFFGALLYAAENNVQVQILIDGKAGRIEKDTKDALMNHQNIEYYEFSRFNFFSPHLIPVAMHDKYLIADNKLMIFGGRNIGAQYFGTGEFMADYGPNDFIDRDVLVYNTDQDFKGSIADTADYFDKTLTHPLTKKYKKRKSAARHTAELIEIYKNNISQYSLTETDYAADTIKVNKITLVTNPLEKIKKEPVIAYNLFRIAAESEKTYIESPYLALTKKNMKRLESFAQAHDLTLVTNSMASTYNLYAYSAYYLTRKDAVSTGLEIYEYQSAEVAIHTKTFIFDDRLTAVGTFNFSERSMHLDTESMLIIDSYELNDAAKESLQDVKQKSLRVGGDNKYEPDENIQEIKASVEKYRKYWLVGQVMLLTRFLL